MDQRPLKPTKATDRGELDEWQWEALFQKVDLADPRMVAQFVLMLDRVSTPGPWFVEWESCDCEYSCSHGRWVRSITLPEPNASANPVNGPSHYDYEVSEISEFTANSAMFVAFARTLAPLLAEIVLQHYPAPEEPDEFDDEWNQLAEHVASLPVDTRKPKLICVECNGTIESNDQSDLSMVRYRKRMCNNCFVIEQQKRRNL